MPNQETTIEIPLTHLEVDETFNTRFTLDPKSESGKRNEKLLRELRASIKECGLLQPIVVTKAKNGKYTLIAGFRRVNAVKGLKWKTILAVICKGTKKSDLMLVNIAENAQREDMTEPEYVFAVSGIRKETKATYEEIAKGIGLSRPTVNSYCLIVEKIHPKILKAWKESPKSLGIGLLVKWYGLPHAEQLKLFDEHRGEGQAPAGSGGEGSNGTSEPRKRGIKRADLMTFLGRLKDGGYDHLGVEWVRGAMVGVGIALGEEEIPAEREQSAEGAPATA